MQQAASPADSGDRVHVEALDGLRGIAAISVMLHHGWVGNSHGWLAVDFFYCLSGFVIALAYEGKLCRGLGFWRYMSWRVMRVYPMLLLGGVIGLLLVRYNEDAGGLAQQGASALALAFLAQALLVPFAGNGKAFPLNNVQWSIGYELIVNAVHACLVRVLTDHLLLLIAGAGGIVLIVRTSMIGTMDWGFDVHHADVGLARAIFSFFLGVLMFRHRQALRAHLPRIGFWWLAATILLLASVPTLEPFAIWLEVVRQLATAMVVNPLVVALALNCGAQGRLIRWLGVLSFPLYAIHAPPVFALKAWLGPHFGGIALKVAVGAASIPILGTALLLGLYVDRPLNRLRRRLFE